MGWKKKAVVSLVPDAQPFTSMLGVDLDGSMLYPNRVIATHYYAQLRLPDKGISWVRCSMARLYDVWNGSVDQRKVRGMVPGWIELKYCNTP